MITVFIIGITCSFYLGKLIEFNLLRDRLIASKTALKTIYGKSEAINVSLNMILMENNGYNLFYLKDNSDTDIENKLMINMEYDINSITEQLSSLNTLLSQIVDDESLNKIYRDPIKNFEKIKYRASGNNNGNADDISIYEGLSVVISDFKYLLVNTMSSEYRLSDKNFEKIYQNIKNFIPQSLDYIDVLLDKAMDDYANEFDIIRLAINIVVIGTLIVGAILEFTGIICVFSYTTATLNNFLGIRNLHITYLAKKSERFVLNFRAEESDDSWDALPEQSSEIQGSTVNGGSSIASMAKNKAGSTAL